MVAVTRNSMHLNATIATATDLVVTLKQLPTTPVMSCMGMERGIATHITRTPSGGEKHRSVGHLRL